MLAESWISVLFIFEIVALPCVLLSIFRSRVALRFPSLAASLSLELVTDIYLHTLMGHRYSTYFYTYWGSVFLQSVIRLWIVVDIVQSFPGIGFMPKRVYMFVGIAGATMAVASAAYSLHSSGLCPQMANFSGAHGSIQCFAMCLRSNRVPIVILIDRCINIGWLVFELSILFSIKGLRLGWSPTGAYIANGITARICASFAVSMFLSGHSDQVRYWANGFESLCSIFVFLTWSFLLCRSPKLPESEGDNQYTQSSLEDLLLILRQRKMNR